ncbi:MAG: hypothetical protein RBR78_06710 [Flavobacteriaceae bacterium]|jgi:hypothetical protein|nr:hypothetical protein [Flavobacteriaceae bacterium]
MEILRRIINKLYKNTDYRLQKKEETKGVDIVGYSEAIYIRGKVFFEVETDILCNNVNMLYFNSWHFYTKACEEMGINSDISYEESVLSKYYNNYQPESLYDLYLLGSEYNNFTEEDIEKLKQVNINEYRYDLWGDCEQKVNMNAVHEYGLLRSHGTQFYGPVSKTKGELEFKRLKEAYFSIRENGFKPSYYGHISGYFLKYKNNYRFIVSDGNHRAGVLCALKYKKISVKFHDYFPRVVDYKDIKNFPLVKKGVYSKRLAKKIFLLHFKDDSLKRAKKLKLLEDLS